MPNSPLVLVFLAAAALAPTPAAAQDPAAAGQRAPGGGAPPAGASASATVAEVRAVIDRWVAAYNRDDAAGVAGVYAPNGAHVVGTRTEGRAAIQEVIARSAPQSTGFSVSARRSGVVGNEAWETGVATQTITPTGGPAPYRLSADYVAILARQPDGTWQIQTLMAGNQRRQPRR